jgi:hypothetical protein
MEANRQDLQLGDRNMKNQQEHTGKLEGKRQATKKRRRSVHGSGSVYRRESDGRYDLPRLLWSQ